MLTVHYEVKEAACNDVGALLRVFLDSSAHFSPLDDEAAPCERLREDMV